jgi:hypothetical protein
MKQVTFRTLVLLVELLAVVAAHQFLTWTPLVEAGTVWLNGDPNEPADPNALGDPQPESVPGILASRVWLGAPNASLCVGEPLDDEPVDPNGVDDPNAPDEPQPEAVFRTPAPAI